VCKIRMVGKQEYDIISISRVHSLPDPSGKSFTITVRLESQKYKQHSI